MTSGTSEGRGSGRCPPPSGRPRCGGARGPAAGRPRHPFPERGGDRPKGLNVLGTLAHHPTLTRAYHTFNGHVLFATTLSVRQRSSSCCGSPPSGTPSTSGAQHVVLAGDAGIDDDEVDRVADGPTPRGGRRSTRRWCGRSTSWSPTPRSPSHLGGAGGSSTTSSSWTSCSSAPTTCSRWPSGRSAWNSTPTSSENKLLAAEIRLSLPRRPIGRTTAHAALHEASRGLMDGALRASTPEPVSYEDSISPEHYELERDAIFRRTWLNVGRVEQLPRNGSYFTKELDAARTSVVVVRTWAARSGPSTTSAATAATSWCGTTTPARRSAAPAGSSPASTTAGATASTAS